MKKLSHKFVEFIPEALDDGILYVSIAHGTVVHRCCCGCKREVVTPLTPADWKLIFDGETVSLHPSIGNWNFSCRSHYWITKSCIEWAPSWGKETERIDKAKNAISQPQLDTITRATCKTHEFNFGMCCKPCLVMKIHTFRCLLPSFGGVLQVPHPSWLMAGNQTVVAEVVVGVSRVLLF